MGKKLKIVVIGGGSSYTPEIVEGFLLRYHELPVSELWLVDVEAGKEKLEIVGNLARRMIEATKVPVVVNLSLDRRNALKDADFVVTQLRVGQMEARIQDEKIPLQFGVIGQETTGPGGMMKALRTIPVMLDICKDMEELCSGAWLLNFTNPSGMVTEAILKYSNIKAVGICNVPIGFRKGMEKLFGVPMRRILPEFVGINHLHWVTELYIDGDNKLSDLLNGNIIAPASTNIPQLAWDTDMLRNLGALPSNYLRYYYLKDQMLAEQKEAQATKGTRGEVVKTIEAELFKLYKDPNLRSKPKQLEERGGAYYSEAAVNLIHSIYNNVQDIQTLNVKNGRIIEFLPESAVIEVNCVVTASGPIPIPVRHIPEPIKSLLYTVKSYEALAIDAAVTGDRRLALQALSVHPLVPSFSVAKDLLEALLVSNKPYLSRFF